MQTFASMSGLAWLLGTHLWFSYLRTKHFIHLTHVFVHVMLYMYSFVLVQVETRGWWQVSLSILFLRWNLSLNLELIVSARLAGQVFWIYWSLPVSMTCSQQRVPDVYHSSPLNDSQALYPLNHLPRAEIDIFTSALRKKVFRMKQIFFNYIS